MDDARDALTALLPDGADYARLRDGPFRRALRLHPHRGTPTNWGTLEPIPWSPAGRFHAAAIDPSSHLDYHTGVIWAQDAASQVPVLLLDPQPGEVIIDTCAAPGSKTTQIGLALGAAGVVVACDASDERRGVLAETLARQGVISAVVTPMRLEVMARRHPGAADAVLVDAPCSGHGPRKARQVVAMARRQAALLIDAATLVRPGGRLVYSTCTPHRAENEDVVLGFLAAHPGWVIEPVTLPGCDADLDGLGGVRLWPHRQGTEPFFACRLRAPGDVPAAGFAGILPEVHPLAEGLFPGLHIWRRGEVVLAATALAAAVALPADARGVLLGRVVPDGLRWEPWAVQAAIAAGAPALTISQAEACTLWAGGTLAAALPSRSWVRTEAGAPLGQLDASGTTLVLPARMRRHSLT